MLVAIAQRVSGKCEGLLNPTVRVDGNGTMRTIDGDIIIECWWESQGDAVRNVAMDLAKSVGKWNSTVGG